MKNDKRKLQFTLTVTLLVLEVIFFFVARNIIIKKKQIDKIQNGYYSGTEYVRTIDCAPVIDKYGIERRYEVSFEIKADIAGNVQVYFQNGSGSKYNLSKMVYVTTEYNRYKIIFSTFLEDEEEKESYLAFYGGYGSGVNPRIRYIDFKVCE